jgi:hypothetical protein
MKTTWGAAGVVVCLAYAAAAAGCSASNGGHSGSSGNDGGGIIDPGRDASPGGVDAASPDTGAANTCPDGTPMCGSNCCDTGAICVDDGTGNALCAQTCNSSNQCPSAKQCCSALEDTPTTGLGACMPVGTIAGQACMCDQGADCESGSCGYLTDSDSLPLNVNVCVANDGSPYGGCDSNACGGSLCCVNVGSGSTSYGSICQQGCQNSSQCDSNSTCEPLVSGNCSGYLGTCVPL